MLSKRVNIKSVRHDGPCRNLDTGFSLRSSLSRFSHLSL